MEQTLVQEVKLKKKSLRRFRNNVACVNRLMDKVSSLDARLTSVRSPNYSGMPRGGTPVTKDELISEKLELESRIERLKEKGRRIKLEILEEIDTLDNANYCEVLEAYYIDCKKIEDIAEEMGYTTRYVYELYSDAIEELVS